MRTLVGKFILKGCGQRRRGSSVASEHRPCCVQTSPRSLQHDHLPEHLRAGRTPARDTSARKPPRQPGDPQDRGNNGAQVCSPTRTRKCHARARVPHSTSGPVSGSALYPPGTDLDTHAHLWSCLPQPAGGASEVSSLKYNVGAGGQVCSFCPHRPETLPMERTHRPGDVSG